MVDFRILNGSQTCTVVECFDNRALVFCGGKRMEFPSLEACKKHISENGLEMNICHLFGSSIKRQVQKGN